MFESCVSKLSIFYAKYLTVTLRSTFPKLNSASSSTNLLTLMLYVETLSNATQTSKLEVTFDSFLPYPNLIKICYEPLWFILILFLSPCHQWLFLSHEHSHITIPYALFLFSDFLFSKLFYTLKSRYIFLKCKFDHMTPLYKTLHWLSITLLKKF